MNDGDLTGDGKLHLGEGDGLNITANFTALHHNPVYLPPTARVLFFEYQVVDPSGDDKLDVSFSGDRVTSMDLDTRHTEPQPRVIWIHEQAGGVAEFGFELNAGTLIGSNVLIDNVQILQADSHWTNPVDRFDVNANGRVEIQDAFRVIDYLRTLGIGAPLDPNWPGPNGPFVDNNENQKIDIADGMRIVDRIRQLFSGGGEGEPYLADWRDEPLAELKSRLNHNHPIAVNGEASAPGEIAIGDNEQDFTRRYDWFFARTWSRTERDDLLGDVEVFDRCVGFA